MGRPRFRPAQLFANPRHFGRLRGADPIPTPSLSDAERAWAWYQHQVALALRAELVHRRMSLSDFIVQLDADPAWLSRKLNGQAPADLGEILGWALTLGAQILPPLDSDQDLLPLGNGTDKR
jgi:hypothetical protein